MKVAIMQPTFLPWIGYFAMIKSSDIFVFLDTVQFEQRSWQSRNKILLNKKEHLLSLSCKKAPQKTAINDIYLLDETKWKNTLLKSIHHGYSKSKNFKKCFEIVENALKNNTKLADLNINIIKEFVNILGIKTRLLRASSLHLAKAKKEGLLLEICKALKATVYLSAQGSKAYLENYEARVLFANSGVKIEYFNFTHPVYKQMGGGLILCHILVSWIFVLMLMMRNLSLKKFNKDFYESAF